MTARLVFFSLRAAVSLLLVAGCVPPAASSKALTIEIPQGSEIVLDGTLSPDEWGGAYRADFGGDGDLLLMHHDGYLVLGVRGKPEPAMSVCVLRGSEVVVMHSSAALGTAIYREGESGLELVRQFSWSCRDTSSSEAAVTKRAEYLESEGWVASNGRMGVPEEVEMRIKMPGDRILISVASIGAPDYEDVSGWPAGLEDGCRDLDLIQGSAPDRLVLTTDQWAVVSPAP